MIPELGKSPGRGHGNLLQYSYLENPHEQRSLASHSPWGCKESDMTETKHSAAQAMLSNSRWIHIGQGEPHDSCFQGCDIGLQVSLCDK